jgi:quercetin dioxygenase-like cupin family protein
MTSTWRLAVYDLRLGRSIGPAERGRRYLYVVDGTCRLESPGAARALAAGDGAAIDAAMTVAGDGTAWLCEAAPAESAPPDRATAFAALSKAIVVGDAGPRLFRVDRIDLSAGAQTPRHLHRGPGIRRLIAGRVRVEIGGDVVGAAPGGAWFEPGDAPVVGANGWPGDSAFLRVSLLPIELLGGKSSFIPVSADDAARPRAVAQRLLYEAAVDAA